jgi:hypothetical protein
VFTLIVPFVLVALAIAFAFVSTASYADVVKAFEKARGKGKPEYGQFHPNGALSGELGQELPLPRYFRQATSALTREQVAEQDICGGDPGPHREKIEEFGAAGFDHVYVHQGRKRSGGLHASLRA